MNRIGIGIFVGVLSFGLTACSGSKSHGRNDVVAAIGSPTNVSGPAILPNEHSTDPSVNPQTATAATDGAPIRTYLSKDTTYALSDAVITNEAFVAIGKDPAAQAAAMKTTIAELSKYGVQVLSSDASTGYFKVGVPFKDDNAKFAAIRGVSFSHRFVLNGVPKDTGRVDAIKKLSEQMNDEVASGGGTNANYSGLERIHEPEFQKLVKADLGTTVDGSSVNVGVTDTGITYNHPTFFTPAGKSRVKYMKEMTGEGTMYFGAKSVVTITASATDAKKIIVNGSFIVTTPTPNLPLADQVDSVKDFAFIVTPEQKALLIANSGKALFTILDEKVMTKTTGAEPQKVDLNKNGKLDDTFPAFLIPGDSPETSQFLVDFSGKGDFTNSAVIGDFNTTGKLLDVGSEKIGIHLTARQLPNLAGDVDPVIAAGIVGFDPGNHGSHVSGIIGGYKTIANDSDDTLARGVAPNTNLMVDRVCANNGGCDATEAMLDLAKSGAEVINMSIGGLSAMNDGYSAQDLLLNRLSQLYNTTFVVAAGNDGPGRNTVSSPSVARLALSIGATASRSLISSQYGWPSNGEDDFMLYFSSRGPTAAGGFKPNLSAPGTELSSVQLNAAPGERPGLNVFWGTSMATPTTTGAYALLLDAAKKYNVKFPNAKLPTDAATLREVITYSARPFDVARFDPATGEKLKGQYTWMDEGTGMLDLASAWKKLKQVRDGKLADRPGDLAAKLDYSVVVSMTNPNGAKYDGSTANPKGDATFGTGIYLDANGTSSLVAVDIARKLPLDLALKDDGSLSRQLADTQETFVLKTVYFGSEIEWLKVGTRGQTDCLDSPTGPLTINGVGAITSVGADGKGSVDNISTSTLNVCIDRLKIRNDLAPGDHGALIYGYAERAGKTAVLPSFVVPVSVNVPHKTLQGSTGYDVKASVKAFGVNRNYVRVPPGTSVVQITLTTDPAKPKLDHNGVPASFTACSGVDLYPLLGSNKANALPNGVSSRALSCNGKGEALPANRGTVTSQIVNPAPGIWDLNVFGIYAFPESSYHLRVDYITAVASKKVISGASDALNGSIDFTIQDASLPVLATKDLSSFELTGLKNVTSNTIKAKEQALANGPLGTLRKYPDGTKAVTIQTGGAPGSDIDLVIVECAESAKDVSDPSCLPKAQSGGPTDEESVTFAPAAGMVYGALVAGYDVKGGVSLYNVTETLSTTAEAGTVAISGDGKAFTLKYGFSADAVAKSAILNSALFKVTKAYSAVGALTFRSDDGLAIGAVPVEIAP